MKDPQEEGQSPASFSPGVGQTGHEKQCFPGGQPYGLALDVALDTPIEGIDALVALVGSVRAAAAGTRPQAYDKVLRCPA